MRKVTFHPEAWEEYLYWQRDDRQIPRRINQLVADTCRNGNEGIGKPEPLRGDLSGFWSRRINQEHRLVYTITADDMVIVACRFHYGR
ncbi:Txe/YoeB family addiction module toxin [Nocardia vaccinii]|uniref:Txe/YoeB family addiction module toxin n=1 Tax=Nocardia vaccinii TaxID=1822 RepID=UPI000831540F|nr:Txe/YoeB family addiction module toxin [Nocardia vaccinii]